MVNGELKAALVHSFSII